MSQTYPPGSRAELCAKRRKNQTIKAVPRRPGRETDFDKLAWKRLFSVTGEALFSAHCETSRR
jgi:hypothetical protein